MPSQRRSWLARFGSTARQMPAWLLTLYRHPGPALFSLLLVPSLAISGWVYLANERFWHARESQDLLLTARLAARLIERELTHAYRTEQALAAQPALAEAVKRQDRTLLTAQLQFLVDTSPMIDRATLIDAKGERLVELGGGAPAEPNPAGPVSPVRTAPADPGEKVVEVSVPIHDDASALGVLTLQYRLAQIARWLEEIDLKPRSVLYAIDQGGRLAAHSHQLLAGEPKDVSRWPTATAELDPSGTILRMRDGKRALTAAIVPLPALGWRVVAQQADAAMLESFHQFSLSLFAIFAAILAISGLLVRHWASLHRTTLRVLRQQTALLQEREQQLQALRRKRTPPPRREP